MYGLKAKHKPSFVNINKIEYEMQNKKDKN